MTVTRALRVIRLCDGHHTSFMSMRGHDAALDVDGFVAKLADAERRQLPHYDFTALKEPLRSEFRLVIQDRYDERQHSIGYLKVANAAAWADELGVRSLLEHDEDWWVAQRHKRWPGERSDKSGAYELAFIRYARGRLERLRDRAYGIDPFSKDVWLIDQLGLPEFAYQRAKTISFVGIEPQWSRTSSSDGRAGGFGPGPRRPAQWPPSRPS